MTLAEIQVGTQGGVTVISEAAGCLLIPFIPTGHVVDEHQSREWSGSEGTGIVGIDQIGMVARQDDRLSQHAFVLIGCVHVSLLIFYGILTTKIKINGGYYITKPLPHQQQKNRPGNHPHQHRRQDGG